MTPAVVIGGDVNSLGVVRSLGPAGIPVFVADTTTRSPAMRSRYARPRPVRALEGAALVEDLIGLGAGFAEPPLLLLTADRTVRTVSRHRDRLSRWYRIPLPAHRCIETLLHKAGFQSVAEAHGFPVPRAHVLRAEEDLAKLAALAYPAIVKPGSTDLIARCKVPRVLRLDSAEQAMRTCRGLLAQAPDLIVQEWVDGPDCDIFFCLQLRGDGATLCSFTGRKLHCWPPRIGNTASCTAASSDIAVELDAITTRFFDAAGVEDGPCSMEFKRERRSGRFVMIEPTIGRTDWQEEVATLYGVNIPLAAYCHAFSLPLPMTGSNRRFVWRDSFPYWRSRLAAGPARQLPEAGAVVKSVWWHRDDPMPSVFLFWNEVRKLCGKVSRKAV